MYGIDEFSAIINPPHAGILAVGAATQRPVVEDGALAVGDRDDGDALGRPPRARRRGRRASGSPRSRAVIENPLSMLI